MESGAYLVAGIMIFYIVAIIASFTYGIVMTLWQMWQEKRGK
jgi:hypothetical protein